MPVSVKRRSLVLAGSAAVAAPAVLAQSKSGNRPIRIG
jgi:hypothetical protein